MRLTPENPEDPARRNRPRNGGTRGGSLKLVQAKGVGGVVDPAHIVDCKTLPSSSPLQDVPLQGRGQVGLQLHVFAGQTALVVNKADNQISISVGMLRCGVGKGEVC